MSATDHRLARCRKPVHLAGASDDVSPSFSLRCSLASDRLTASISRSRSYKWMSRGRSPRQRHGAVVLINGRGGSGTSRSRATAPLSIARSPAARRGPTASTMLCCQRTTTSRSRTGRRSSAVVGRPGQDNRLGQKDFLFAAAFDHAARAANFTTLLRRHRYAGNIRHGSLAVFAAVPAHLASGQMLIECAAVASKLGTRQSRSRSRDRKPRLLTIATRGSASAVESPPQRLPWRDGRRSSAF